MALRYYANAPATTLATSATAGATTITVVSVTGLPVTYPYSLILDRGQATEEVVEVTAAGGTTLTVTRGVDSTTAFAHSAGASVEHGISARDVREPNSHINSTSGVHGVSGNVVGDTDTQTVTNKTISADNNTINGFAASSFIVSDGTGKADGSAAQKVIPNGAVVGTTDTQTLTNKTLTAPAITDPTITETSSWTAYSTNWKNGTGGATLAIGNGTLQSWYRRIGKTIHFRILHVRGSTTNLGTTYYVFTLPSAPASYRNCGPANVLDASSTATSPPHLWYGIGTDEIVVSHPSAGRRIDNNGFGATPTAWATSDEIWISGTYEEA